MRRLLVASIMFLVVAPAMGQAIDAELPSLEPEIRLPSITTRWKRPGEKDGAEITLDEIERCIGQDVDMQRDLEALRQRQRSLEPERADLENGNGGLKASAAAIDANRSDLKTQVTTLQSESANLSVQLALIEKRKKLPIRTQAEVNSINSLVSSYNVAVAKNNKRRLTLIKDQEAFNQSVEGHNAAVSEMSQRVSVFNKHNDEFQGMAVTLTKKSEQYVAQCTGERRIRK